MEFYNIAVAFIHKNTVIADFLGLLGKLTIWLKNHISTELLINLAKDLGVLILGSLDLTAKILRWLLSLLPQ